MLGYQRCRAAVRWVRSVRVIVFGSAAKSGADIH